MDTFSAIEKVLHFHHLTSRQPLRVAQLRFRAFQNGTPISPQSIHEIKRIWPEAYNFYTSQGQQVVEALDLPLRAQERKQTFERLYNNKENTLNMKKPSNNLPSVDRAALKPISMGHLRNQINTNSQVDNKKLSLGSLERVRAKESRLKTARSPKVIKSVRDNFLRSQVPKLIRILNDLAGQDPHKAVDMNTLMDILRTNLYKLSDEEISRTSQLAAQTHPAFCSIVRVGDTECVKLAGASIDVC